MGEAGFEGSLWVGGWVVVVGVALVGRYPSCLRGFLFSNFELRLSCWRVGMFRCWEAGPWTGVTASGGCGADFDPLFIKDYVIPDKVATPLTCAVSASLDRIL
jgi:hypothetical protein